MLTYLAFENITNILENFDTISRLALEGSFTKPLNDKLIKYLSDDLQKNFLNTTLQKDPTISAAQKFSRYTLEKWVEKFLVALHFKGPLSHAGHLWTSKEWAESDLEKDPERAEYEIEPKSPIKFGSAYAKPFKMTDYGTSLPTINIMKTLGMPTEAFKSKSFKVIEDFEKQLTDKTYGYMKKLGIQDVFDR